MALLRTLFVTILMTSGCDEPSEREWEMPDGGGTKTGNGSDTDDDPSSSDDSDFGDADIDTDDDSDTDPDTGGYSDGDADADGDTDADDGSDTDSDSGSDGDSDGDADTDSGGDTDSTCAAIDPLGFGACEMVLGVVYDGTECVTASGCDCNPHCDEFYDSIPACSVACEREPCGGWLGDTCNENEYCAYEAGQYCGAADASSVCKPRPQFCSMTYAPVCGCDGKSYASQCEAAAAGTGVMSKGNCT